MRSLSVIVRNVLRCEIKGGKKIGEEATLPAKFLTVLHRFVNKMFILGHIGSLQDEGWVSGCIGRFILLHSWKIKNAQHQ